MSEKKKSWIRRHWILSIFLTLVFLSLIGIIFGDDTNTHSYTPPQESYQIIEKPSYEFFDEFEGLSEIQIDNKIDSLKGKTFKTRLYVSKIDKASLSTQYVAMEMYEYPYDMSPHIKAFFPSSEKDKLLQANIGDILVFSGEFVTYHKGYLTSYIEFTNSKVIDIIKESSL